MKSILTIQVSEIDVTQVFALQLKMLGFMKKVIVFLGDLNKNLIKNLQLLLQGYAAGEDDEGTINGETALME